MTSLRHPLNSANYERVEQLLQDTLRSWSNQTDAAWLGIVVGNRQPTIPLPTGIEFIHVPFEPPSNVRGPRTGIPAVLRDKGTKLAIGLGAARERGATHIMFADADDFVSKHLAAFVRRNHLEPGWTITNGWRYNAARRAVRKHSGDFHLQCGTSHIVSSNIYPTPDLTSDPTQEELYAKYGHTLERWIGSHMHIHDDLHLADLPFPGALYQVGTTEAHSGNSLGGFGNPVLKELANEFSVPPTKRTPWHMAMAVLPSPAALHRRLPKRLKGVHPK